MPENKRKTTRSAAETRPKKVGADAVPRDASGKFLKGNSGNKGGRPRVDQAVRELAGAHSTEALMTCIALMRNPKVDVSTRLAAARTVLDRAVGKPMQPIAGMGGASLVNITLANGGAVVTADDAARAYQELCKDPAIDMSAISFAAPESLQRVEQVAEPAELAPKPSSMATWEALGK